jgi:hypothetical protein
MVCGTAVWNTHMAKLSTVTVTVTVVVNGRIAILCDLCCRLVHSIVLKLYYQGKYQVHLLRQVSCSSFEASTKFIFWGKYQVHLLRQVPSSSFEASIKFIFWGKYQVHLLTNFLFAKRFWLADTAGIHVQNFCGFEIGNATFKDVCNATFKDECTVHWGLESHFALGCENSEPYMKSWCAYACMMSCVYVQMSIHTRNAWTTKCVWIS